MSTIDTLDLKPKAPTEFRGDFNPIPTNVPGVDICEHLPKLARQADKYALLRNFTHSNSGHGPADQASRPAGSRDLSGGTQRSRGRGPFDAGQASGESSTFFDLICRLA